MESVLLGGFNIATNNFPANTSFQINDNNASNLLLFTFAFFMKVNVARMWILIFIYNYMANFYNILPLFLQ